MTPFSKLRSSPAALVGDVYRTVPADRVRRVLLLAGYAGGTPEGEHHALGEIDAQLEHWSRNGLGRRREGAGWLYDPAEVVNHLKWLGLNAEDDFWRDRFVRTGRRLASEWGGDNTARRFRVRFSRRFDLTGLPTETNLRLSLPLPAPDQEPCLTRLEVTPAVGARLSQGPARVTAQLRRGGTQWLELCAEIHFTSIPQGKDGRPEPNLSEVDRERYLRPSEGLVRVTPAVQGLADQLLGGKVESRQAAQVFYDYLLDAFSCGVLHYDQVPAALPLDWVIQRRWYDCQLGSALLVALCRCKGVPARLVSGHLLYRLAPTNHYWAEVWIRGRGWTGFDLLGWDLSQGGLDNDWRGCFSGSLDHRMITQRFPLLFTGPMSVRLPQASHILQTGLSNGVVIDFTHLSGVAVWRDRIERLDPTDEVAVDGPSR